MNRVQFDEEHNSTPNKKLDIGLATTFLCDQNCEYCPHWKCQPHSGETVEVDLDWVSWFISQLPPKRFLHVSLTGGEPGLVSNLAALVELLCKLTYRPMVISNGLADKVMLDCDLRVEYLRHSIRDITEDGTIQYMNDAYVKPFAQVKADGLTVWNSLMLTDSVLRSMLVGSFPKELDMDTFRVEVQQHHVYQYDIKKVFAGLANKRHFDLVTMTPRNGRCPFPVSLNPVIDLQGKRILHCGYSEAAQDCTDENIVKWLHGDLFPQMECVNCYRETSYFDSSYYTEILEGTPYNCTRRKLAGIKLV